MENILDIVNLLLLKIYFNKIHDYKIYKIRIYRCNNVSYSFN
jgi:hypothetical protein